MYAGIFAVAVQFQNQDEFWILRQTSGVIFYFTFQTIKKWAHMAKNGVLGNFGKNQWLSDK